MNIWKRAALYLRRNKGKSLLLLLVLIVLSSAFIVSLSIWREGQLNIRKLRQTYGTAFVMEPDFEAEGVKPLVDADIEKVMSVQGIIDVCKEIKTVLLFEKLEFVPGLYADMIKLENEIPDFKPEDDPFITELDIKKNVVHGCNKSELSNYFRTDAFKLIEGRHITEQDDNKVLISDVMAQKNQLTLGDFIYAENNEYLIRIGGDSNIVFGNYELEIIGIYHVNVNQVVSNYTPEDDIAENFIFASSSMALKSAKEGNDRAGAREPSYGKVTFFVTDPRKTEEIIEKVKKLDIDLTHMKIQTDDSTFQSALEPLQHISKITMFMMAFVVVVCIILLSLILRMWIGTRSKEMGILFSLGNSRTKIVGQLVLEGILFLCVSIVLSYGISFKVCDKVGDRLLSGINAQDERVEKMKEKETKSPEELTSTPEGIAELREQFTIKTEIDAPKELDCRVTVSSVMISVGILAFVLILTTILSARKILKMKPKEILSFL